MLRIRASKIQLLTLGLFSSRLAAEELVFFLAAAVGAGQAAEQKYADAYRDEHGQDRSERK
jgi:hypothetical protein